MRCAFCGFGVRFARGAGAKLGARSGPYRTPLAALHALAPDLAIRADSAWTAPKWGVALASAALAPVSVVLFVLAVRGDGLGAELPWAVPLGLLCAMLAAAGLAAWFAGALDGVRVELDGVRLSVLRPRAARVDMPLDSIAAIVVHYGVLERGAYLYSVEAVDRNARRLSLGRFANEDAAIRARRLLLRYLRRSGNSGRALRA